MKSRIWGHNTDDLWLNVKVSDYEMYLICKVPYLSHAVSVKGELGR